MALAAASAASAISSLSRPGSADAGASSITFWWRRWMEQSRSNRCTALPWESANIWTSTWRGRDRYFSTSSAPSPKAALASRRHAATAAFSADRPSTTRMPRPPPPLHALTSTG